MLAPLGGQVPRELYNTSFGSVIGSTKKSLNASVSLELQFMWKHHWTYAIGYGAAHAGNESHAPTVLESDHLLRDCLRGHKHARHINLENAIRVFGKIIESRDLLLDTSRSDQTVHTTLLIANVGNNLLQRVDVPDIDLPIVQTSAQFILSTLLYRPERFRRLGQTVQGVHCSTPSE